MPVIIPVQQLDVLTKKVIREYPSIAKAAEKLKLDESTIRKKLNKNLIAGGYLWKTPDSILIEDTSSPSEARILLLDIETAPLEAYVWGLWDQNIAYTSVTNDWFMLTWAAKWLGEGEVYSRRLCSQESIDENDSRITIDLWDFLDEADIVITHNGERFDIPKINSRFLLNKLSPPSSYKQIDTLKVARKEFGFISNKLDDLAKIFDLDGKLKTNFELWVSCKKGSEEALEQMEDYNRQDVDLLEEVYFKMRPYIKGHPNLDLYIDSDNPVCPQCGEDSLVAVEGKYFYTQAVRYQLYRCSCCKALSRGKAGVKYEHKKQISAIPR